MFDEFLIYVITSHARSDQFRRNVVPFDEELLRCREVKPKSFDELVHQNQGMNVSSTSMLIGCFLHQVIANPKQWA